MTLVIDLDALKDCPPRKRAQLERLFQKYLQAKWEREEREARQAREADWAAIEALYPDDDDD